MEMYRKVEPALRLRDIVESIWLQEAPNQGTRLSPTCVLPTGMVEILFHYGERYVHHEPGTTLRMPRSYVTGQRTRPVNAQALGSIGIVIVSLYPWGISHLIKGAHEVVDGFVDLGKLTDSRRVRDLEDQLRCASNNETRVRRVEEFLLWLREKTSAIYPDTFEGRGLIESSQLLSAHPTESTVESVSTALGMSRRHFGRRFRFATGLSPKMFARILRFQRTLRCRRQSRLSWADIAVRCGYSDQPHMIREMRTFSHRTPKMVNLNRGTLFDVFNDPTGSRYFDTVYMAGGDALDARD